jgi:hypothetical protein
MILGNLMGGLGNQLFQIFATISYALKNNISFTFLNIKNTPGITYRQTYWDSLLQNLSPFLTDINNQPVYLYNLGEEKFSYTELPLLDNSTKTANIQLNGYFQSYKYFEQYFPSICSLIQLEKQKDIVRTNDINSVNFDKTISIHFRIGDYKSLIHLHPIMTKEYYEKSLKYILDKIYSNKENKENKKIRILYFCEEKDKSDVALIIDSLKDTNTNTDTLLHFECVNFALQDWEQMLLMSTCKYNIIANSTFSWWSAYFNSNKDKIVCYPNIWFNSVNLPHDTNDLFPKDWIKINV